MDVEEQEAEAELRVHEAAFPGLRVTRVVLTGNHAAVEIISWLQRQMRPVDFIVMATTGAAGCAA